ncbi:acyl-homoserine-lactone synthase [Rhodospirillaceae bacterium SYSU D60014]|uniref:acyl-homoserine-lactone synthase n=1 Tax=Virgifigura deserti TaxID=2268457 RepID=UPI000E661F1B
MENLLILPSEIAQADPMLLDGMFRLRHEVFKERLGWDVISQDRRERDGYDALSPVYLIYRSTRGVEGCWRLLPTTGPYMLKDVFSELLDGTEAPERPDIWEISRFAVLPGSGSDRGRRPESHSPGHRYDSLAAVHQITCWMLIYLIEFARKNGIRRIVAASDVRFERILHRAGLPTVRLGQPRQIGVSRAVAGSAEMSEENLQRVRARLRDVGGIATPAAQQSRKSAQGPARRPAGQPRRHIDPPLPRPAAEAWTTGNAA